MSVIPLICACTCSEWMEFFFAALVYRLILNFILEKSEKPSIRGSAFRFHALGSEFLITYVRLKCHDLHNFQCRNSMHSLLAIQSQTIENLFF